MIANSDLTHLSDHIDAALRSRVSPNVYGLWFQSLRYSLDGTFLIIECPGLIHKEHVMSRHQADVVAAAGDVLGFVPRFEFRVVDSVAAPASPSVQPGTAPRRKRAASLKSCDVHPGHSFDKFVVGPDNQIAFASCLAIAQESSRQYNPLFLHGPTGLGKTHLLQAAYHHLCKNAAHLNILYTNCETFTNEFISAIRSHSLDVFRGLYRSLDVLIVDDIQFLADKTSTQEEFFHTFNDLILSDKRVVLSSDSAPHDLQKFESRLISRFSSGLITSIQPPGYETRLALIRSKCLSLGLSIEPEVETTLASMNFANVRELHGALVTMEAHTAFTGLAPTVISVKGMFTNLSSPDVGFERIVSAVCRDFDVSLSDLQSKKRPHSIAFPRQLGMYLLREHTRKSLNEIGLFFGGRDHSTVQYAHAKISAARLSDMELSSRLQRLEDMFLKGCE